MTVARIGAAILVACYALIAVVMLYDVKRALKPGLPGEAGWRRARLLGTTTALLALSELQRLAGPVWFRLLAMITLLLALALILRCSIPLKRMVAAKLREQREHD